MALISAARILRSTAGRSGRASSARSSQCSVIVTISSKIAAADGEFSARARTM